MARRMAALMAARIAFAILSKEEGYVRQKTLEVSLSQNGYGQVFVCLKPTSNPPRTAAKESMGALMLGCLHTSCPDAIINVVQTWEAALPERRQEGAKLVGADSTRRH